MISRTSSLGSVANIARVTVGDFTCAVAMATLSKTEKIDDS